jgi:hypothetical protein
MSHVSQVIDFIRETLDLQVLPILQFGIANLSRAGAGKVHGPIVGDRKIHGTIVVEERRVRG